MKRPTEVQQKYWNEKLRKTYGLGETIGENAVVAHGKEKGRPHYSIPDTTDYNPQFSDPEVAEVFQAEVGIVRTSQSHTSVEDEGGFVYITPVFYRPTSIFTKPWWPNVPEYARNHRETDKQSISTPKLNVGNYRHQEEIVSQRDDDALTAATVVTFTHSREERLESRKFRSCTNCNFIHEGFSTCAQEAALRGVSHAELQS